MFSLLDIGERAYNGITNIYHWLKKNGYVERVGARENERWVVKSKE
jgi:hypothetical protein